jgi:hypothetical protein
MRSLVCAALALAAIGGTSGLARADIPNTPTSVALYLGLTFSCCIVLPMLGCLALSYCVRRVSQRKRPSEKPE